VKTNVTTGNLSTLLGTQKNLITVLTLTEEINKNDFDTIRSMINLSVSVCLILQM